VLAIALALALARQGDAAWLIDLDPAGGDIAGGLGIDPARGVGDLTPVIAELGQEHLRSVAHPHPSGVWVLAGPSPGRAGAWGAGHVTALAAALRASGAPALLDAGRATSRARAADPYGHVLIVAPSTLAGVRRARRAADASVPGAEASGGGSRLVLTPAPPGADPLPSRQAGRAVGLPIAATLPSSPREAARLAGGRWPSGRRTPLADAIDRLAADLT
jgi:hypothetical protein